jgi:hypothetical protein
MGVVERKTNVMRRAPSLPRIAHVSTCILLLISAVAFFFWLPLVPTRPLLTDFSAYYAAGRYWLMGGDPYGLGIWSIEQTLPGFHASRFDMLPFVGPPLSLPLWAAFGALPYLVAAVAWGITIIAAAASLVIIPARLAHRRIGRTDALSLLVVAVSAGPLVTGASVGQAALPAAAAVAAAILCAARRQWLPMALATIVAGLLKPNDALALAATAREAAALCALAASIVASSVANLPFANGVHGIVAYANVLLGQGASERTYAYQFSVTAIAFGFGMAQSAAQTFGTVVSIVAIGAIIVALRATRASIADGALIACAALPFVLPFEHEPDMVVALVPALVVAFRARGWAWALGAAGTVLLCIDPFALTQGWPGLLFAVAMAAIVPLQLAALAPAAVGRLRLVPLAVAPLILAIGLFAPAQHLPLWPATLPDRRAPAAGATASSVWHDELVAIGLEDPNAWVSVLRLLTLCGCGCIGVAMLRTARESSDAAGRRVHTLCFLRRSEPAPNAPRETALADTLVS